MSTFHEAGECSISGMRVYLGILTASTLAARDSAARELATLSPISYSSSVIGALQQQQDLPVFRPVHSVSADHTSTQEPHVVPLVPASLENSMSFREDKVGFLGATSYSAVFTENRGSLGIVDPEDVRTIPFSLVLAQQPRLCCRV